MTTKLRMGVPLLGNVLFPLEEKTSKKNKDKTYHAFVIDTYLYGSVRVTILCNLNETMHKHLSTKGAPVLVNADEVDIYVPEKDGDVIRYTKEGTYRTGKVVTNSSAVVRDSFRIEFVPRDKSEGNEPQSSNSDTVRGNDDSAPASNSSGKDSGWDGWE
jgi:hypothetical protein